MLHVTLVTVYTTETITRQGEGVTNQKCLIDSRETLHKDVPLQCRSNVFTNDQVPRKLVEKLYENFDSVQIKINI